MKEKILMMCGTSIFEKYENGKYDPEKFNEENFKLINDYRINFENNENLINVVKECTDPETIKSKLSCIQQYRATIEYYQQEIDKIGSWRTILKKDDKKKSIDELRSINEKLSAEMAFLTHYIADKLNNFKIETEFDFVFITTDSFKGKVSSAINKELYDYFFEKISEEITVVNKPKVTVEVIKGLQMDDSEILDEIGIINLLEFIQNNLENSKEFVILNITGGYKCIIPYLYVCGCFEEKAKISYLHENSDSNKQIVKLPLNFNLTGLMDYESILKMDDGIDENLFTSFPNYIKCLFSQTPLSPNNYKLNYVGKWIKRLLENIRGNITSFYGFGYLLLDFFTNETIKERVKKKIETWEHVWIGDLIPETVEHARGHCQRLMIFAFQIISRFKDMLNDNELEILIYSIWLHDIGHSGYALENSNFEISLFPSIVRDLHNVLSYQQIKKMDLGSDDLKNCVADICLYHRFRMPIKEEHTKNCMKAKADNNCLSNCNECKLYGNERKNKKSSYTAGCDSYYHPLIKDTNLSPLLKPLEMETLVEGVKVRKRFLGALLRLLDCFDVQKDRTIGKWYLEYRNKKTREQYETIARKLNITIDILKDYIIEKLTADSKKTPLDELIDILTKIGILSCDSALNGNLKENFNIDDFLEKSDFFTMLNLIKSYTNNKENEKDKEKLIDLKNQFLKKFCIHYSLSQRFNQTETNLFYEYYKIFLSLLDQYLFKIEQDEHFTKHSKIDFIYLKPILLTDESKEFGIDIKSGDEKDKTEHLGEVKSEYEKIESILLENKLKINFN